MASSKEYKALLAHLAGLEDGSVAEFDSFIASQSRPSLGHLTKTQGLELAGTCYRALLAQTDEDTVERMARLLQDILPRLSYEDIIQFDPPVDMVGGLSHPIATFGQLILAVLDNAAGDRTSARGLVANQPEAFRQLITFWLTTDVVEQADEASRVIVKMLRSDVGTASIDDGIDRISLADGLPKGCPVWAELFGNEDTLGLIVRLCRQSKTGGKPSRADASIARARLMDWIGTVGLLNWYAVSENPVAKPVSEDLVGFQGLVQFTMGDIAASDDPLSALVAIKCLIRLLRIREDGPAGGAGSSLEVLRSIGIHDLLVNTYLNDSPDDSLEAQLILPAAAEYVASFLRQYPDLFVGPDPTEKKLLGRILDMMARDLTLSSAQWALVGQQNSSVAKAALHLEVLAAIPRSGLLAKPIPDMPPRAVSAVLKVPLKAECPHAIVALGRIFNGPASALPPDEAGLDARQPSRFVDVLTEATAARDLYLSYLRRHPESWQDVVTHGKRSLGQKPLVLASINFIRDIVTARWTGVVNDPPRDERAPLSGSLALLASGTFDKAVPFLLDRKPANGQTVAGSGRLQMEDPDHHALHTFITDRFDIVKLFKLSLERDEKQFGRSSKNAAGAGRIGRVLTQLKEVIAQGPWNATVERSQGPLVATESAQ